MPLFKSFHSESNSITDIITDINSQLHGLSVDLIVCFASPKHDIAAISEKLNTSFHGTQIIGCSTSGELSPGKLTDGEVCGLAFLTGSIEDFRIEVATNVSSSLPTAVRNVFSKFERHFHCEMKELDPAKHVGILLIDGLSGAEEKVNETIGDLTNISFIGGSAGDDLKFKQTFVFANGQVYSDAAVLALLKPVGKFDFLKTQSFAPTAKVLKATKTNEKERQIIEFNNKPATEAYAEALGVPVTELSNYFFKNPIGLMFGDEPFVRSPRIIDESTIRFYCSVKEDMDLCLLKSTDIVEDTKRDLNKKIDELGGISAILNFNCILRTLDLKQQQKGQEYADIFKSMQMAGFSTYGESYIGHVNQTATMLILK